MKYSMFIGRWQPWHDGHRWLINQRLNEGKNVLICIREVSQDDKNPYNTSNNAVASSGSFVAGQVSVSASGSTLTVKTCTKTGCASADQLTATVSVD